ncbi:MULTISPECIES: phospholipid carrier-dependent glycosyltransferase [Novosphingobium]|uniref:Polyprenol-phosphate-mannose--protein mannosyltransferase n=1 Tax=Novosphingobium mathurense TaxID=428990 RepID=A0A1U6GUC2_9SPHN|nr:MULTISPECIES: phospholipid carrier-dependent glycosyltransferase [Novosphingobium]CDO35370.1 Glycosyl transferase, family 39 [Novosphingobium sp. KN65.2]SLJ87058.1 Dolichyl-phosphate-mannose-protein mannosyltransferase [Novosphingobium mathurense]
MPLAPRKDRDPLGWCLFIALGFLALLLWRIHLPGRYYFDEIHYVPASLKLLDLIPANREHPMFAKEVIATSIHFLGDRPIGWRLPSALFGALGLFGFGRLMWHASHRRAATLAAMMLLATNFMWFVQSRIAMLDMIEAGLCMVGLWQFAAALRSGSKAAGRFRLLLSGLALGLSIAAKWTSAPAVMLPGLCFLVLWIRENGLTFAGRPKGGPVKGISLIEAAFWLGLFPLAVYWATYAPAMFYTDRPVSPFGFLKQHEYMLRLQESVKKPHPYRSVWYQWVGDLRVIWYLFETVKDTQRGIVMLGNPFSMMVGLLALLWGIGAAIYQKRHDVLVFVLLYAATLGVWIYNAKPVQFYYHYLLPGAFLMGVLALALDAMWASKGRWQRIGTGTIVLALGFFVLFFPILSGLPLPKDVYNFWMWLPGWR